MMKKLTAVRARLRPIILRLAAGYARRFDARGRSQLAAKRSRETKLRDRLSVAVGVAFFVCSAGGAHAQTEDAPKIELGVHFSSLGINNSSGTRTEPGFGGRLTYNLTDHVALEAEGNFFPTNDRSFSAAAGGNLAQAQFGVKAGKRFEKFGVFAKARPGFVSFSRTLKEVNFIPTGPPGDFFPDLRFGRSTYFATDAGIVLEFYPSRRLVTRFDFGDTIIRYGERPGGFFYVPPTVFERPAETLHNFQFSAGIGFRF